ncbi:LOG family protein [Malacoplasma iowae]|uniref:DNA protecting protein n=2 Tax=Malacoplasma iowae TaxID=2116 RepID=A0A084U2Q4_MALIO|nr:hypothetical protein [Malacoplasma iowae]VEU63251.1 DNA processing protein [Mycoplasmopsis fermentans]EGZ31209.1 hypothetical protein GUU_03093 [Malacoplasma iowae 695]KFB07240.1 DNA protecting protein [Malacoplasma iowae DK-CPA]QHG89599.1 hypothetical protein EER00_01630 [Malacoplasma iowae 695]WPL35622.1 hypothetical protein QX180_04835 [Malacoplasma iowae]
MEKVLLFFTIKYRGDWDAIFYALSAKEAITYESAQKLYVLHKNHYISLIDRNYPIHLKSIYKPPFSLFVYGNRSLLFKTDSYVSIIVDDNNLNQKLLDDILKNKFVVYIVDFNQKKLINFLLEKNIRFIALYKYGLNNIKKDDIFEKIIDSNNLVITEIPNKIKSDYYDQSFLRIIFGISKNLIFDCHDKIKLKELLNILRIEKSNFYWYDNIENIFEFKKINSISDFFEKKLLH